jgi:hypothetical protein
MINLTDGAKKYLDNYLQQVRNCLKDCPTVDADEVEQNIKEHIENELQSLPEPISFDSLNDILKKLGSPQQWLPEAEIAWWRKMFLRLRTGPEDWRLAYISFGLLFLSAIFFICGTATVSLLLVLTSFCLSRAALSAGTIRGDLGAQKCLIYPSLIIVYLTICGFPFLWPVFLLGTNRAPWNRWDETVYWMIAYMFKGVAVGLYYFILVSVYKIGAKFFHIIFRPFAEKINPKYINWLLVFILILIIFCLIAGILMFKDQNREWYIYLSEKLR